MARPSFRDDGDRGSKLYVRTTASSGYAAAAIPPLDEIKAMVLLDMVGDCDLQIPREFSSNERLYAAFEKAAGGRALRRRRPAASLDDHTPFQNHGIPAVDLIDFTFGGSQDRPVPTGTRPRTRSTRSARRASRPSANAALKALPTLP